MDTQRNRSKSFNDKNEVFFIGDELRTRINFANLIKDRKYHFKTYKKCFIGKEVVSWLQGSKLCDCRETAVKAMQILQDNYIIHHVVDDHTFKDDMLFYRFRIDDGTFENDMDLTLFYKGQQIYRLLSVKKKGIIRDYKLNSHMYKDAFIGSSFVDWLVQTERVPQEDAVDLGKKLLDYNIIRHVTDDHHFMHDNCLLYQFSFDFQQTLCFQNIFKYSIHSSVRNVSDSSLDLSDFKRKSSINSEKSSSSLESHEDWRLNRRLSDNLTYSINESSSGNESDGSGSIDGEHSFRSPKSDKPQEKEINQWTQVRRGKRKHITKKMKLLSYKSKCIPSKTGSMDQVNGLVLLRHATATELESPETPYIKRTLRIPSDSVGYGFVLRGDGPTYVQTVDPTGPAAAAGLKVRQYIHSVNGENVLRLDHKQVAKKIVSTEQFLHLSIMVHKRDALFLD